MGAMYRGQGRQLGGRAIQSTIGGDAIVGGGGGGGGGERRGGGGGAGVCRTSKTRNL